MINALVQVASQGAVKRHVGNEHYADVRPLFEGFRYLPTQGEYAVMQTRKDAVYLFVRRLNLFDELQEWLFVYQGRERGGTQGKLFGLLDEAWIGHFILARLADCRDYFRRDPVRERFGPWFARTEGQLINGGFVNTLE